MKSVLTAALVFTLGTVSATAADLSPRVYTKAAPVAYAYDWTGFYIGGQVGYAWGQDNTYPAFAASGNPGVLAEVPYGSKPSGLIGGLHAGYNVAVGSGTIGNAIVVGLEADVDFVDRKGTAPFPTFNGDLLTSVRSQVEGSVRGRLGVAFDRTLIYATGGVAFSEFKTRYYAVIPGFGDEEFKNTRIGWTAGAGVEYAVTNNWSVRGEYRYTDYGTFTDATTAFFISPAVLQVRHSEIENRVQAGFSYKFGGPVLAKY